MQAFILLSGYRPITNFMAVYFTHRALHWFVHRVVITNLMVAHFWNHVVTEDIQIKTTFRKTLILDKQWGGIGLVQSALSLCGVMGKVVLWRRLHTDNAKVNN